MSAAPTATPWRTVELILLAGCAISMIGFGVRSSLGLFIAPMETIAGWPLSTLALALAVQNLLWGIALPIAGGFTDRYGARPVITVGATLYAIGLYGMTLADSASMLVLLAGVMAGTGIAFSAFSIAMVAMVKAVGPEKRSITLGLGTAAGSLGQVVFSPLALYFIESGGWVHALVILSFIILALVPLAFVLPSTRGDGAAKLVEQTMGEALFTLRLSVCIFQRTLIHSVCLLALVRRVCRSLGYLILSAHSVLAISVSDTVRKVA